MADQVDRGLVVLVDDRDIAVGTLGKHEAHVDPGFLHRAVSVCLLDEFGRVLLQQRASTKYHFAGLWSNACCTHPSPREQPAEAAIRRTGEELGLAEFDLEYRGSFMYRAFDTETGLVEVELDHVYLGTVYSEPRPDPREVMDWRFVDANAADLDSFRSSQYTPWLHEVLLRSLPSG
jgi:isopentenyl-diphosphate delta-isomerase